MQKIKLVYIMGAGRSGSTILGILLGNLRDSFFAGELFAWIKLKGSPKTTKKEIIDFWWKIKNDIPNSEELLRENYFKAMEYHTSLFSPKWLFNKKMRSGYWKYNVYLLNAIKEYERNKIIVDSSNYPLRAYWLNKCKDIELKVIYLVRNPYDVINSFQKKNVEQTSKNPLNANIYLLTVSILSTVVFWLIPKNKKMKVRYEDVGSNPEEIMDKISMFLGVENTIENYNALKTGYIFEGNRIRNKDVIALKSKKSENFLNKFWLFMTRLIQWPFLLINNYAFQNKQNY